MIRLKSIVTASGEARARTFLQVRDNFPAQFYLPTRPIADFIRDIGTKTPQKRIFLNTAANGTGKTTAAFNIILNLVYPGLNLYTYARDTSDGEVFDGFFNYPFFQNYPRDWPKQIWYISNKDALAAIDKKLKAWVSPEIAAAFKYNNQKLASINFPGTDWSIWFKTIDQDPATFETADVGVMVFDEPPPYRLYAASISRLRLGGIVIIPATPLFSAAWFLDEIVNKATDAADSDKIHQTMNVWTNCIEQAGEWDLGPYGIQRKGNLWQSNIEMMLRNWDPDEIAARRDGVFKALMGAVFKTYKKEMHMLSHREPALPSERHFMYRMTIDPHDRRPPAIVWSRIDDNSGRYYMREWPSIYDPQYHYKPYHRIRDADPYTIKDFVRICDEIERDELHIPRDRLLRIMDPNFGRKPNRETGRTVAEDYIHHSRQELKEPWSFNLNTFNEIYAGHQKIKEMLKADSKTGRPGILIDPSCSNINYSFTHYMYADMTTKDAETKEVIVKVKEIGKDFIDAIRYDAMLPFTYEELEKFRNPYGPNDYGEATAEFDREQGIAKETLQRPAGASGV